MIFNARLLCTILIIRAFYPECKVTYNHIQAVIYNSKPVLIQFGAACLITFNYVATIKRSLGVNAQYCFDDGY